MFSRLRRFVRRFFNKSRKVNHEPINKASLIVIILVDLFILFNVFAGLDDISRWPLSPRQAYPCHSQWQEYRNTPETVEDKDYTFLDRAVGGSNSADYPSVVSEYNYQSAAEDHLGKVSPICLQYERDYKAVDSKGNIAFAERINNVTAEIQSFEQKNAEIRQQYDSTLLEKIAGQPRDRSINNVEAAQAKTELESGERAIAQRKQTLDELKSELINTPESQTFLALLNNDQSFAKVDRGYNRATFFYPSIQLFFQALFLLPLIVFTLAIHRFAQRRDYDYVALITWHLLVIFSIPLIWKIFEFLQIGFLFEWLADFIYALFGQLRFLYNYVQILLIPLIGFGIIKFFQKVVFNTKRQAANRVQKMRCVRCAKKIRKYDIHCPHCQYEQYQECANCHHLTYRHLSYCKHCGTSQPLDL